MKTSSYSKTLLAATLGLFIAIGSTQAVAHEGQRQGMRGAMSMNYIADQLDITEEQQTQVHEIMRRVMTEQRDAMRAEMKDTPRSERSRPSAEDIAERRAQMNTLLSDELGTVLRPEQIDGLLTYMNAHMPSHDARGHMRGGRMGDGHGRPEGDM
ncbi:MAG: hypothetical protein JXQ97_00515 [Natronospirillum sp.]